MKKQTISLCMIVKNEERLLGRCLESVKSYVDEMIIVDTGSTDNTVEIANSFGAKVIEHKWKQDFSEARNKALEYATGDWILQLDADEYFIEGTQNKLIEQIEEHKNKNGLLIQITNLVKENDIGNSHVNTRLFRNQPGLRYIGAIHEQITVNGKVLMGEWTSIRIVHSGYVEEVMREKGKKQRNMTLLRKELQKNPNNGFHNYNISNEYLMTKEYKKALDHAQKAYKFGRGTTYEPNAVLNIVWSLYHMKRYEEALKLLNEATSVYKKYTDLLFIEGLVLEKQGRIKEAQEVFRKCIENGESDKNYYTKKGIGSIIPAEKLAYYSVVERDYDLASKYLTLLLGVNKKNEQYAVELSRMLKRNMTDDELYDYLTNAFRGEKFDTFRQSLYLRLGVKKGIKAIPTKENMEIDIEMKVHWYNNRFDKATQCCLRALNHYKKKVLPLALSYYLVTGSQEIKEAVMRLDKTAKMIIEFFEGKSEIKKINYNEKTYLSLMSELIDMKKFDIFEKLYELKGVFQPKSLKMLGDILFTNHFDDLSLECYVEYLKTNEKDTAVWLKASEMLFNIGKYQDAIIFADMAFQKGSKSFRMFEIIIESLKKLEEYEELMSVCQRAIEEYPESTYIMETIENVL